MDSILRIPSVTGVDLELRIAGPGGRSYAFVIDWHIRLLAALAWFFLSMLAFFGTIGAGGVGAGFGAGSAFSYIVWLPSLALYFLYHPVLEVLMKGRTPGKRIAGVRLVNRDGGLPGVGTLLIRNMFRLIDSLPFAYCIGLASTILTKHSLRIGDIAAGTILVYDEAQGKNLLSELSAYAVERIGLEQAQIVRDLLHRWNELNPEIRATLAGQLLDKFDATSPSDTDADLRLRLEQLLH